MMANAFKKLGVHNPLLEEDSPNSLSEKPEVMREMCIKAGF